MIARLPLLPNGVRQTVALTVAGLSLLVPAFLIWTSLSGLAAQAEERDTLLVEIGALAEALDARAGEAAPMGAPVARTVEAADRALSRQTDRLAAALAATGARVEARGAIVDADFAGVAERRLTVSALGSPDALSTALIQAAEAETVGLAFLEFEPVSETEARVTLVLIQVLAGEAGDAG